MSSRKQLTLHTYLKKSSRNSTASTQGCVTSIQIQWLLDAVRHVKAQKQRPDRERICHYIQQQHDLTSETVSLLLDSAVKENILTTTITRGNTDKLTYVITPPPSAAAAAVAPPASPAPAPQTVENSKTAAVLKVDVAPPEEDKKVLLHNKSDISPFMVKAVKALRESSGSSLNDIAEYILTSCNVELKNGVNLIRLVKLSARQAVRNGMLIKNKENLYKVARGPRKPGKQNDSPDTKPKGKAKPIPICCFCLGDEKKNRDKKPEEMVSCCRCGQSGHPSCLKFSASQTEVVQSMDDWECYDCKKCSGCKTSRRNDNDMLICDRCDRSFHPPCCRPPVKKPPDGTWICHICMNGNEGKWKAEAIDDKKSPPVAENSLLSPANKKVKFGLLRKKYEFKHACATPGCNGSGNINSTMSNHRRQTSCPLLSKEERKKIRKQLKEDSGSEDGSKESIISSNGGNSVGEEPLIKGLKDGLSQFFTPTEKRTSRVSMSSLITATTANKQNVKLPKTAATTSQAAANKLVKKSKLVQQSKVQSIKKTINNNTETGNSHSQPASSNSSSTFSLSDHMHSLSSVSQLKGLVDGMTRFFTPTGERKRSVPIYAAPVRKRKDTDKSGATRSGAEDSDIAGILSDASKSDSAIVDSIDKANLPAGVSFKDYQLFRKSQKEPKEPGSVALLVKPVVEHGKRYPPAIEFGKYELQTWYSSPYPQEYAQLSKLYICEFCLKYMKSKSILHRHMDKCGLTHPPANEIYRKDNLSVFEVDGNTNKIYCQNLCLLAKLFLDHKTLYYDVEPFLFYVLTCNDTEGCHFIGYFSKEKHCQQKYNVSCITTLPHHQRKGYGKFLIDFSYLLSRIEGTPGSPEKPLSELGKISYKSYWKCTLLRYLHHHRDDISLTIKGISSDTGMCAHDIASTLQDLHMIDTNTADDVIIAFDSKIVATHISKLKSTNTHLVIDEDCVRWTPVISSHGISSPEKSSSPDKASVVSLIRERRITIDAEVEVAPEPVKSPPPRRASSKSRSRKSVSRQGSANRLTSTSPTEKKSPERGESPRRAPPSTNGRTQTSPARSPVRSPPTLNKPTKSAFSRKLPTTNGPSLTNGVLPLSASRRRQSQVSSSDEEDNAAVKPKPHPPKKRRVSCKEEKISRRKSGSPSTPEKKHRYSSTRSNTSRKVSRSSRQQNSSNSQYSNSTVGDRRNQNGKSCAGLDGSYLSDASSRDSAAPCYDASASDIDSDNSEMELSSSASAVWSPTIQPTPINDSPSTSDDRLSRLDRYLQDTDRQTPTKLSFETGGSPTLTANNISKDNSKLLDDRETVTNIALPVIHKDEDVVPARSMNVTPSNTLTKTLPVPQSYPPNTAPEIDPATLCFESPISLSSNDTSLNGSQPAEHISQHIDQQPEDQRVVAASTNPHSYNTYTDYNTNNVQQPRAMTANEQLQESCNSVANQRQQTPMASFVDSIPSISTEQQSHDYPTQQQPQPQPQQQHCYNSSTSNRVNEQQQQHASPQSIQQHSSPMFPPQSPQIMIPNSPHLAPQSPQVPQKSPLLHPQSPHFNHTGPILSPGHPQTPYTYRGRAGSMSTVTPPDLTPPPGTPSPSKLTKLPSDRYQQYLQQNRIPQKSPNVTINSRDNMQYGVRPNILPDIHQNMQNLNSSAAYPMQQQQQQQQPMNPQHFFPSNQYMDPHYLNSYHMQIAQTAHCAGGLYGQLPANGMYGYNH